MRQGVARIVCEGLLEAGAGLAVVVIGIAPEVHDAAQKEVIGREADGRLAQRLPDLCILDPPDERRNDRRRDLVLDREDIFTLRS